MNHNTSTAGSIVSALEKVRSRIKTAAEKHGRDAKEIKLLAVSKAKPVSMIVEAIVAGQLAFGENYVQEACQKLDRIDNAHIEWHFLGSIQSNKTRRIAASFSWVHGIDRESILRYLSRQRPDQLPPINVCVQMNLDGEKTKSGTSAENVERLLDTAAKLPNIKLRGLMTIPSPTPDIQDQRQTFARAKSVFDKHSATYKLDTLSMGMSRDFETAIAEGATLVRLGTAIFGDRIKQDRDASTDAQQLPHAGPHK